MKKDLFVKAMTVGTLISSYAYAADTLPTVMAKHYIKNAIELKLTQRGLDLFKNDMDLILSGVGVGIDEFYLKNFYWQSDVTYKLNELSSDPKTRDLIIKTQGLLSNWFLGLSIQDIKPSIKIDGFDLKADFNKFAITTDPTLLKSLNKTDGIIVILEADIKHWEANLDKITMHNDTGIDLGTVGVQNFKLDVSGSSNSSFKMRMPFYVRISETNGIEFQALDFSQNIMTADMTIHHGNLITPDIQLIINKKVYSINKKQVEKQFDETMPDIINQLRGALHNLAKNQAPDLLNNLVRNNIISTLEEVQNIPAPNDVDRNKVLLNFGLHLTKINQDKNGLNFNIDGFIEDPLNPKSSLMRPILNSKQPTLGAIKDDEYDFAIAVDQNLLDRAIQLSYERHLFKKVGGVDPNAQKPVLTPECQAIYNRVNSNPSATIEMMNSPRITSIDWSKNTWKPNRGETLAKLKLEFKVPAGSVNGYQTLFVKDRFTLSLDVIVKIQSSKDHRTIEAHLWDIDEASVNINSNDINLSFIAGYVKDSIINVLRDSVKLWKCSESVIADKITPPSLPGVGTSIEHISMEPTGHLVLYLNFVKPNKRGAQ